MLLCVEPYFRIVYVSDPLKINPYIFSMFSGPRFWSVVQENFIFPVGLLIEKKKGIVIGAHINDHGSTLLRWQGLEHLLSKVIDIDKEAGSQEVGYYAAFHIQNYLLRRMEILKVGKVCNAKSCIISPYRKEV